MTASLFSALFPGGDDSAAIAAPVASGLNDQAIDNAIEAAGNWSRYFGDKESTAWSVIDVLGGAVGLVGTLAAAEGASAIGVVLGMASIAHTAFGFQPFKMPHLHESDSLDVYDRATRAGFDDYTEHFRENLKTLKFHIDNPADLTRIEIGEPGLRVPAGPFIQKIRTNKSRIGTYALGLTQKRSVWLQRQRTLHNYLAERSHKTMTIFTPAITEGAINKLKQEATSYYAGCVLRALKRKS